MQQHRHHILSRWARRAIYSLLVGREGWPLRFHAPAPAEKAWPRPSPNLYIHLPFCQSICPHCPYNKQRFASDLAQNYQRALLRELDDFLRGHPDFQWRTLYFGGGTPSLTPESIAAVITRLRPYAAARHEIGVEVHPSHATAERLAHLSEMGVTRISLGIETLHEPSLQLLRRSYTAAQARTGVQRALKIGFECVDVNLIYGIPDQPWQASVEDARVLAQMGVEQISAYPLFSFAHTAWPQLARRKKLSSSFVARLRAQKGIAQVCLNAGLARTSVWSYTQRGVSPYTTVTREDYVGFGAGAGSKIDGKFWFNTFSVPAYIAQERHRPALTMQVTPRMQKFHWIYWRIYETWLDYHAYEQRFGSSFGQDFGRVARLLKFLGWAREDDTGLYLTERGAVWAHMVQALFSLSFIDDLWRASMAEPWPQEVVLR